MANTDVVLQGVKDYTLELLGTKARDEAEAAAVDAAGSAAAAGRDADRAEGAEARAGEHEDLARGHEDEARVQAEASAGHADRADGHAVVSRGWASQSKDAAALAITAAATVTQYVGDGFPEGKVAAPVGSIYTDRLVTAGAVRWIKTQGTGNTGWQVEYGDTGWRDITTEIVTENISVGAGGYLYVRRTERYIEYAFNNLTIVSSGNIFNTPSGFRALRPQAANAFRGIGIFVVSRYWLATFDTTAGQELSPDREFVIRFNADPAWPSTLPGTPS